MSMPVPSMKSKALKTTDRLEKYKLYLPTKKELEAEVRKEATRLSLIKKMRAHSNRRE
jgi:hypothetical protein